MAASNGDRNLLFGILAVQMDFVSRDQLLAGMNAWILDKQKALGQILQDHQVLSPERHALLEALVQEHLKQHGNDPRQSLAAISSAESVRQDLQRIDDADVGASLAHVAKSVDPNATVAPSTVGQATSTGTRFRILRPHAKGGLGDVHVAHDKELHREVGGYG